MRKMHLTSIGIAMIIALACILQSCDDGEEGEDNKVSINLLEPHENTAVNIAENPSIPFRWTPVNNATRYTLRFMLDGVSTNAYTHAFEFDVPGDQDSHTITWQDLNSFMPDYTEALVLYWQVIPRGIKLSDEAEAALTIRKITFSGISDPPQYPIYEQHCGTWHFQLREERQRIEGQYILSNETRTNSFTINEDGTFTGSVSVYDDAIAGSTNQKNKVYLSTNKKGYRSMLFCQDGKKLVYPISDSEDELVFLLGLESSDEGARIYYAKQQPEPPRPMPDKIVPFSRGRVSSLYGSFRISWKPELIERCTLDDEDNPVWHVSQTAHWPHYLLLCEDGSFSLNFMVYVEGKEPAESIEGAWRIEEGKLILKPIDGSETISMLIDTINDTNEESLEHTFSICILSTDENGKPYYERTTYGQHVYGFPWH